MSRTALFRKTLLTAGMFAILPCVLPAQEQTAEEARSAGAVSGFSLLDVENESLLRAEFPGHKNWGRVKKGAVLEGRLSLPLYSGEKQVGRLYGRSTRWRRSTQRSTAWN